MKKLIYMLMMVILICVIPCGCAEDTPLLTDSSTSNEETVTIPLIERLEFSVNDIVLNAKPEDLYYQICDVYLSPMEALSVSEFVARAQKSSMKLTYNICEDDISMTYADYSDNYLVTGCESVNVFFYCEEQLVFELVARNLTDETLPIKECYAFEINEMHECFSKNAVDVKSRSWYCGGIAFGGDGYTYATIKERFVKWGLTCEEESSDDGALTIYSSVISNEISVDFQNKNFIKTARYYATVDKSTGDVIKFHFN